MRSKPRDDEYVVPVFDILGYPTVNYSAVKRLNDSVDCDSCECPEKGLLCAVLERALRDLYESGDIVREVVCWFTAQKPKGDHISFSFAFICEALSLSAKQVEFIKNCVRERDLAYGKRMQERQEDRAGDSQLVKGTRIPHGQEDPAAQRCRRPIRCHRTRRVTRVAHRVEGYAVCAAY